MLLPSSSANTHSPVFLYRLLCFSTFSQGENRIRGEFTVVLGPFLGASKSIADIESSIKDSLRALREDGVARSEAVKITVKILDQPKSAVYKVALSMPWEQAP
jgi:16S rRNA C1402 (ribose-2'-O) methylase RsmI